MKLDPVKDSLAGEPGAWGNRDFERAQAEFSEGKLRGLGRACGGGGLRKEP